MREKSHTTLFSNCWAKAVTESRKLNWDDLTILKLILDKYYGAIGDKKITVRSEWWIFRYLTSWGHSSWCSFPRCRLVIIQWSPFGGCVSSGEHSLHSVPPRTCTFPWGSRRFWTCSHALVCVLLSLGWCFCVLLPSVTSIRWYHTSTLH